MKSCRDDTNMARKHEADMQQARWAYDLSKINEKTPSIFCRSFHAPRDIRLQILFILFSLAWLQTTSALAFSRLDFQSQSKLPWWQTLSLRIPFFGLWQNIRPKRSDISRGKKDYSPADAWVLSKAQNLPLRRNQFQPTSTSPVSVCAAPVTCCIDATYNFDFIRSKALIGNCVIQALSNLLIQACFWL